MNDKQSKSPAVFLDIVDAKTHDGVIRLQQKLRGLQAEIMAKLESLDKIDDESAQVKKEMLQTFQNEIDLALKGISDLVNIVVPSELSKEEFVEQNRDNLNDFRDLVMENMEKISKISRQF